ncbi:hypothetical protein CZP2022_156 [Vibrio phage C-ZP2022]|nr:hypothetical protein CZP2022_156 [Vibrio phage C-ZP2022]
MRTKMVAFRLSGNVDEISNAKVGETLRQHLIGPGLLDLNTSSYSIYNFNRGGADLYVCRGDGHVGRVPPMVNIRPSNTEHSQARVGPLLDRVRAKDGILIEVTSTYDLHGTVASHTKLYDFVSIDPPTAEDVARCNIDNYSYLIFVSSETLQNNLHGVYLPFIGVTIGVNPSTLMNKVTSLHGSSDLGNSSALGLRFHVSAPEGHGGTYYYNLNGMTLSTLVEETSERRGRFVLRVYVTTRCGEELVDVVHMDADTKKVECDYDGQKYTFALFDSKSKAEKSAVKELMIEKAKCREAEDQITELKAELERTRNEAKNVKRDTNQSFFGKLTKTLSDIIAPVLKLLAIVGGIFALS